MYLIFKYLLLEKLIYKKIKQSQGMNDVFYLFIHICIFHSISKFPIFNFTTIFSQSITQQSNNGQKYIRIFRLKNVNYVNPNLHTKRKISNQLCCQKLLNGDKLCTLVVFVLWC